MTNECLMGEMFNWLNFQEAFDAVRRNKGSAGIDHKRTILHWQQHGAQIEAKLKEGSYVPSPVLGVKIPKPNGGERLLGIPTVQDRVIQQAMQQILTPIFDSEVSGWIQPPDAENRISSGVGEVTGAIPLPRPYL